MNFKGTGQAARTARKGETMVENFINGLSAYLQGSVSLSFLAVYLGGC